MISRTLWHDDATAPLEARHAQLQLTAHAMWSLLKDRLELTDAQLERELARTNARAAQLALPQLTDCHLCKHPIQRTAKRCLYCGTSPAELRSLTLQRTLLPPQ